MIFVNKRLNVIVSGRVQGVGYRYFAKYWAEQLGVNGFVRNLEENAVEIVAEGSEHQLLDFLARIKKGPGSALVEKVSVDWLDKKKEFYGFEIEH